MSTPFLRPRAAIFATAIAVLACGGSDSTAPGVEPALAIQGGATQSATVGTATPAAPSVVITDRHGAHPAGVVVTFTPDSGAGSVAVTTATTNAAGVASAGAWTLGTRAQEQHLSATATVDGTVLHATFVTTAVADRAATMKIASGGTQDGPFGATLATPVRVLVTDRYDNPKAGVTIRFGVDSGAVTDASATTGADGTASTRVRLPVTTGAVLLSATADSIATVTSTLTSRGVRFASFSIDANNTCGLSIEGYPYCWGDNGAGQLTILGVPAGQNAPTPQPIAGDNDFTSISLANVGGCGLRTDGSAVCWGSNVYGANGNGTTSLQLAAPAPVVGNLTFVEVQRGPGTTCGATKSGQAYCWGGGGMGQLGSLAVYQLTSSRPALVDGGLTLHSFALGTLHSCALDPAGQAYCWGSDWNGRLGVTAGSRACTISVITSTGTTTTPTTCSPTPVAVSTTARFATLAATSDATCGLTATGDTYCWGSNDFGELGTGGFTSNTVPAQVQGVPAFRELHGHDRGFCGLTSGGDIYCWGYVTSVLGVPYQSCTTYNDCTPTPTRVQAGRQFSTIAFTTGQLCGLSNGVAYCWGLNYHGALGIGVSDGIPVPTPTQVSGQTP